MWDVYLCPPAGGRRGFTKAQRLPSTNQHEVGILCDSDETLISDEVRLNAPVGAECVIRPAASARYVTVCQKHAAVPVLFVSAEADQHAGRCFT